MSTHAQLPASATLPQLNSTPPSASANALLLVAPAEGAADSLNAAGRSFVPQ